MKTLAEKITVLLQRVTGPISTRGLASVMGVSENQVLNALMELESLGITKGRDGLVSSESMLAKKKPQGKLLQLPLKAGAFDKVP